MAGYFCNQFQDSNIFPTNMAFSHTQIGPEANVGWMTFDHQHGHNINYNPMPTPATSTDKELPPKTPSQQKPPSRNKEAMKIAEQKRRMNIKRSHQELKEVVNMLTGGEEAKTVAQVCRRAVNILENLNSMPDYVQQPASIELGTNQEIEKLNTSVTSSTAWNPDAVKPRHVGSPAIFPQDIKSTNSRTETTVIDTQENVNMPVLEAGCFEVDSEQMRRDMQISTSFTDLFPSIESIMDMSFGDIFK